MGRLKIAVFVLVSVLGFSRLLLAWDWLAVKMTSDQSRLAQIAMESRSPEVCKRAVQKLENSALLVEIALDPGFSSIGCDAVNKLFDQELLARIAVEAKNTLVQKAAVQKLIDQELLARIALENPNEDVCVAAVDALSDQICLAKVAMKVENGQSPRRAAEKLYDPGMLLKTTVEANDTYVCETTFQKLCANSQGSSELSESADDAAIRLYGRVFQKIRSSSVPIEHQKRLFIALSRILRILNVPKITKDVGSLEDLTINWGPKSEEYHAGYVHVVKGEKVSLSVMLSKSKQPIRHIWSTQFPYEIRWKEYEHAPTWWSAGIDAGSFYSELSAFLSQSTHAWMAREADDWVLRRAAVEHLTNQVLLAQISVEDNNWQVCEAAVKRLSDQPILAGIAMDRKELKHCSIRRVAAKKLTDQVLLAKLALEDKDDTIRSIAVENVDDQVLLSRIAVEDQDQFVRKAAMKKLELLYGLVMNTTNSLERASHVMGVKIPRRVLYPAQIERRKPEYGNRVYEPVDARSRCCHCWGNGIIPYQKRGDTDRLASVTNALGEDYPARMGSIWRKICGHSLLPIRKPQKTRNRKRHCGGASVLIFVPCCGPVPEPPSRARCRMAT
jgi:hypothetical protein